MLKKGERIDQLYSDDIQIIQSADVFSFSLDAVLLANFPKLPKKGPIIDLCAGNGAVGLFASRHTNAPIIQVELQERLADMGRRSIELNNVSDQITMLNIDLKDSLTEIKADSAELIMCNPPYFKELPTSAKNPNPYLAAARHEIHATLDDVIAISAKLLKTNGRLAMVHRPDRFLEILKVMEHYHIAPKRIQFVYPKKEKDANILLIEGIKQGKLEGLKILPPLFVHEGTEYTAEIKELLYGK